MEYCTAENVSREGIVSLSSGCFVLVCWVRSKMKCADRHSIVLQDEKENVGKDG